ncbi:MAG: hypothetical protein AB7T63_01445 [Planctomycetota bacterium]
MGRERDDTRGEARGPAPVRRRTTARVVQRGPVSFPVGDVLAKTFAIFGRYLPLWLVLGALAQAPSVLYELSQIRELGPDPSVAQLAQALESTSRGGGIPGLISVILGLAVTAFTTHVVLLHLDGRRVQLGETFGIAMGRLPAVLGTSIIMGLAMGAVAFVVAMLTVGLKLPLVLAVVLMLLPALLMYLAWFVAIPATVAERKAGAGALQRSGQLTRGARWQILGALSLFVVLGLLGGFVLGAVFGPKEGTMEVVDAALQRRLLWLQLPLTIVVSALMAILSAVAYRELRVTKEGVSSKELADVFA